MKLKYRQLRLLAWCKSMHILYGEPRKDGEEYYCHVLRVGKESNKIGVSYGLEIGFCHDLVEDTIVRLLDLKILLVNTFNYTEDESKIISEGVFHLTDVYTTDNFPNMNRKERKKLEAERLWTIPPEIQTIKYCDLIDNTDSIITVQPKFSEVYLKEKKYILKGMNKGNPSKYKEAVDAMIKGEEELLQLSLKN